MLKLLYLFLLYLQDLHHFLLETIRTATDQSLDTNKMELFIVILQILSLVINRKRDKIRFKELKRHFIEFLIQKTYFIDDNNTIRKNIAKKSLSILISCDIIIIGATNDDAYSRNANTRKVNIGDENDADVESDTQGTTYQLTCLFIIQIAEPIIFFLIM